MIKAELLPYRGTPAIHLNGKPIEPIFLFGNNGHPDSAYRETYQSEIRRAAHSGTHIHTMILALDFDLSIPAEESNAHNRKQMHEILENDPNGYLLPRLYIYGTSQGINLPESENEYFSDGLHGDPGATETYPDFISDVWRKQLLEQVSRFIRSILADELLRERVIGYHYSGGQTGEWFQRRYGGDVLNISEANVRGFRRWLTAKYSNDKALSEAWGYDISIKDVVIPVDLPGYKQEFSSTGLLEGCTSRRFVDYLDYFSDEVSDLIEEAAAVVKQETDGNSLFVSFYGYHFEIPGAFSGHNSLAKLLKCPDVDILSGPVSYTNRNEKGMGAFMSEAASVIAAGKLWMDESDYRMPIIKTPYPEYLGPYIQDLNAAHHVILREYGKLALYGAGTWWMDLVDEGWFDDDAIWDYISEGKTYYTKMREAAVPAVAEVCYLVDEKAMSMVGDTFSFAADLLYRSRNEAYFSGLSYDLRLIEDFIDGKLEGAKLYVFVNPFRLHDRDMETIKKRLRDNGTAALWLFGFGLTSDQAALQKLTGFSFSITPDAASQLNALDTVFKRVAVSPLTVPQNGETLGTYEDGRAAFAKTNAEGYTSYFCGGSYIDPVLLRYVAQEAGARLYTAQGDCFNRIGSLAMLHTSTDGIKTIDFDCPVTELRTGICYEAGQCTFQAQAGETFLFITKEK